MKCLQIYTAIIQIFFNFTIAYIEKKIYFCQKFKKDAPENSDNLSFNCNDYDNCIAFFVSIMDTTRW